MFLSVVAVPVQPDLRAALCLRMIIIRSDTNQLTLAHSVKRSLFVRHSLGWTMLIILVVLPPRLGSSG